MAKLFRFMDWPLRAKIVALLVAASLVPLAIATWISVENIRDDQYASTEQLLTAHAQMLARRIDASTAGYARVANILALSSPATLTQLQAPAPVATAVKGSIQAQLLSWARIDPAIISVALLDLTGKTLATSDPDQEGRDLSYLGSVRNATRGATVISDIFLTEKKKRNRTPHYRLPDSDPLSRRQSDRRCRSLGQRHPPARTVDRSQRSDRARQLCDPG